MKHLPLTLGQFSLVDDEDFDWLSRYQWSAKWNDCTQSFYVGRKERHVVLLHRQILGLERGDGKFGDHINGDTLDNRRSNLRIVTHSENQHNQKKHSNNTSGFTGVVFNRKHGTYHAQIMIRGKRRYLGSKATAEEAAELYRQAKVDHNLPTREENK